MKYVIYGAGAIGGVIAAHLARAGAPVTVIARGDNLKAIRQDGIRVQRPDGEWRAHVGTAAQPSEMSFGPDDVVVMAMKTQDTMPALAALASVAPAAITVVCAQNGVENERLAQRFFDRVHGMFVFVFGVNPAPGLVQCFTTKNSGVLDIGVISGGEDARATAMAADLVRAGFDSVARPDIMKWKYSKLLTNLANAFVAAYGSVDRAKDRFRAALAEGRACYAAAGIEEADESAFRTRRESLYPLGNIGGAGFPGGSSWQSLARGSGATEVDYLSGEIVRLGRKHGVPTPVNTAMQALVRKMAVERAAPGSASPF